MRIRTASKTAAFLVAVAMLPALPARAEAPAVEQALRDFRANEEALVRLRQEATSVLDELAAVEEEVRELETGAALAEAETRAADAKVAAAEREAEAARARLIARLEELAPRLRVRYELGRRQRLGLLLATGSMGDRLRREKALDRIVAGDLELLAHARRAVDELERRQAVIEEAREERAERSKVAGERRARARKRKDDLLALHESLMQESDLKERTLRELYRSHAALSRYVTEIHPESKAARRPFSRRKGRMPFPAKGFVEVGFGKVLNPKFNTVTFQKGVDIRSPEGTEVVAVASGTVVHAGPFRGYGNLVIVDHGRGYHSLYAHLGTMTAAVGAEVGEAEAIGTVGDTGSLKGPYLYFEIRERGRPVDPLDWLGPP